MSSRSAGQSIYRPGASLNAPQSRYPGFAPGQTILKAGTLIKKGALPLAQDLRFDRDATVVTRDGITLGVDVYRPAEIEGPLPAIISWSPYGKSEGYMTFDDYQYRGGVAQPNGIDPVPAERPGIEVRPYSMERVPGPLDKMDRAIAVAPFQVRVAQVFPLDRAADAQEALGKHRVGKLLLQMND